jgi:hypothetical protein
MGNSVPPPESKSHQSKEKSLKQQFGSEAADVVRNLFGEVISPEEVYLLDDKWLDLLKPALEELKFPVALQPGEIYDLSLEQNYKFYRIWLEDGYIALVYFRNKLLDNGIFANSMAWMGDSFTNEIFSADGLFEGGAKGLFFFSEAQRVAEAYETWRITLVRRPSLQSVKFFLASFKSNLERRELKARQAFVRVQLELDKFKAALVEDIQQIYEDLKTDETSKDKIIDIMSREASNYPTGTSEYFRDLVKGTKDWKEEWQNERSSDAAISGDPRGDARKLVNYALNKGTIPGTGYKAVLCSLLEVMIAVVGDEDRKDLDDLIKDYNLKGE